VPTAIEVATIAIAVSSLSMPSASGAQSALPAAWRSPELAAGASPLEIAPPTIADSIAAAGARTAAERDRGFRVVVSIADRRILALDGSDTLMTAPAAVGMDRRLTYDGRSWRFHSPRGVHEVMRKTARAAWIPPEWHYAEVARGHHFRLARLPLHGDVLLSDGRRLTVQRGEVGILGADGSFSALPRDEEIVFDSTVFIPPMATRNRAVEGELGRYQLDLGDGYLIHGTPQKATIGTATTHGCMRLHDAEIAWLFEHVSVGTRVYIY
jgi:lipoprotein-anchoring transpeptidase ErfK/SrfK